MILSVVENPEVSVRRLSRDLYIKQLSVGKSLKHNKFHSYSAVSVLVDYQCLLIPPKEHYRSFLQAQLL